MIRYLIIFLVSFNVGCVLIEKEIQGNYTSLDFQELEDRITNNQTIPMRVLSEKEVDAFTLRYKKSMSKRGDVVGVDINGWYFLYIDVRYIMWTYMGETWWKEGKLIGHPEPRETKLIHDYLYHLKSLSALEED